MSFMEKGLQSSSSKQHNGASGRSRKLIRKEQKRRLASSKNKNQLILEMYLLIEGQRIDCLLLSVESMLSATRDLIQTNEMIPTASLRTLKEQKEILSKKINKLKTSTLRKFKRKITRNWITESIADMEAVVPSCE